MTKKFSVTVTYKDNVRPAETTEVNSIEAIVRNLRIMREGDTFTITRQPYYTLKDIRRMRAERDNYGR